MDSWRFQNLRRMLNETTPPYTRWFKNLKTEDWKEMLRFLIENDHLGRDEYQFKLNRHFLEFELRLKRPLPPYPEQIAEILGNLNVKKEGGSDERS